MFTTHQTVRGQQAISPFLGGFDSEFFDRDSNFSDQYDVINTVHQRVIFSIAWQSFYLYSRLLFSNVLVYNDLAVNLDIKVSKTLTHWLLLLASFRFCVTQYLHFTTQTRAKNGENAFLLRVASVAKCKCDL